MPPAWVTPLLLAAIVVVGGGIVGHLIVSLPAMAMFWLAFAAFVFVGVLFVVVPGGAVVFRGIDD